MVLLLSLFDIILLGTSVFLLFIPHAKWWTYTQAEIQSTAQHLIELLRSIFWGIFRKLQIDYFSKTSLDGRFKLTSDTFIKSMP